MPPTDIEGEELKSGDRVVIPFEVVGVHADGVALKPCDPRGEKHPTVCYEARLAKKMAKAD